ncbi:MAG: phosphoribosylformylglycinamidine synthase [Deltaproteobacteria bacterium]|nr:phosphoribosylformylglycinamidine synthase [Deltaproteobacteria bacterium]
MSGVADGATTGKVHRVEVGVRAGREDAAGRRLCRRLRDDLGLRVDEIRLVDVYTIAADLAAEDLEAFATGALADPVLQELALQGRLPGEFDWAAEVNLRPGVTDNVGRTAAEALALQLGRPLRDGESVSYARQYRFAHGPARQEDRRRLVEGLLCNLLIEAYRLWEGGDDWFAPYVPRVLLDHKPQVRTWRLDLPDDELQKTSRDNVWALSLAELRAIQAYFERPETRAARARDGLPAEPTDVEMECLAQTWSEHCKHKIFSARVRYRGPDGAEREVDSLFRDYVRGTTEAVRAAKGPDDPCISVFDDNAGVVRFLPEHHLVFKVETHNSPSALDPYGGALTGIVGVNRDPFGTGMGARLFCNTDVFCFAPPDTAGDLPPRLLHPRRVMEGVREGVEHGGNKSGIPTVNGSVVFHSRYLGKPLVYCGTGGILPAQVGGRPAHLKYHAAGDAIVMVGGRIGKDGIHGATFSSEELHEGSPATAVQIGDPITQKRMTDFLLVARDRGLYSALTDDGAGGLSSSIGEMARTTNGADVDLTGAPLKYAGLDPWEIFLSEAQERMTVAVPPAHLDAFLELAAGMGVLATAVGRFTGDGILRVRHDGRVVAALHMDFLHDGLPRMDLRAAWASPTPFPVRPAPPADLALALDQLLRRWNVCSKHYFVRQYDHEVQGGSVVKPLCGVRATGPSDAAVIRPVLGSPRAVAVAHGIAPKFADLDARSMAASAIDEAIRNAVAVGADPATIVGLDNFCWPDPIASPRNADGEHKLAQLVRACETLRELCVAHAVPLISGKDSMKNDYHHGETRISIPPTLLFTALGQLPDAARAVTMDLKRPGESVYVVGRTLEELGGSEYFGLLGEAGGVPPDVRPEEQARLYRKLHAAIVEGLVSACHDCSDGGLGVALAEAAFAGDMGLDVDLRPLAADGVERDDLLLFSESNGRFVVSVRLGSEARFETRLAGLPCRPVGKTRPDGRLRVIGLEGAVVLDQDVRDLETAWRTPLDLNGEELEVRDACR